MSKKVMFGVAISWIFLWPIIMAFAALLFAVIRMAFVGDNVSQEPIVASRAAFNVLYFFGTLVLASLVLKWMAKKSKDRKVNLGAPILGAYMWIGILLGGLLLATMVGETGTIKDAGIDSKPVDFSSAPPVIMHNKIAKELKIIGATHLDGISTKYVKGYKNKPLQEGEYQSYVNSLTGEYLYGDITIKKGLSAANQRSAIAHEYLHHVWFTQMSEKTKDRLTSDLITTYGNDPAIRQRTQNYSDARELQPTELFSFYCTESSDVYLTGYILRECNKYIQRSRLTLLR